MSVVRSRKISAHVEGHIKRTLQVHPSVLQMEVEEEVQVGGRRSGVELEFHLEPVASSESQGSCANISSRTMRRSSALFYSEEVQFTHLMKIL